LPHTFSRTLIFSAEARSVHGVTDGSWKERLRLLSVKIMSTKSYIRFQMVRHGKTRRVHARKFQSHPTSTTSLIASRFLRQRFACGRHADLSC